MGENMKMIKIELIGLLIIFFSITIFIASIVLNSDLLLSGVLIVWMAMIIYSITDISNHIVLLFYLISFFTFLIGREVCFSYFGVERYYTNLEQYNKITFFLLFISLLLIWVGYTYEGIQYKFSLNFSKKIKYNYIDKFDLHSLENYSKTCKCFFYICYIISIINILIQIIYIKKNGYLASYINIIDENILQSIMSYMSAFTGTAFCLYLATNPIKKSAIYAIFSYEIYGILTMFTGHRYTFIAISMTIVIYMFLRERMEGGWITKRCLTLLLIVIPFLVILLLAVDSIRVNKDFVFEGWWKSIITFFDQQGGSINVIKRIFYYKDEIEDLRITSFDNLRTVLFENALVRNIFDIKVYSGNSLEHALYGHSLAHRLSYLEYGESYLQGHGVGSSYIAELYHDFGIIGVMIGNFFYGYILKKINNIQFECYLKDGLLLAIMYYLILAPRGNFDGFIGGIFSLYSLCCIALILIISGLGKFVNVA